MKYPLHAFAGQDVTLVISLENLHAGAEHELDFDTISMVVEAAASDLGVDVEIVDGGAGMAIVQLFEALDPEIFDELDFEELFSGEQVNGSDGNSERVGRDDLMEDPEQAIRMLWDTMGADLEDELLPDLSGDDLGEKAESLLTAPVLRFNVIYDELDDGPWTSALLVAIPPPSMEISDDVDVDYEDGAMPVFEASINVPGDIDEEAALRYFRHLLRMLVEEARA
jgi:hypothetical protein